MKNLFIFGLGTSALALACRAMGAGWQVSGTTRDAQKRGVLRQKNIHAVAFDEVTQAQLRAADAILVSIQTVEGEGDPVLARYGEWLRDLPQLPWLGYLSTTGVYGDWGGAWVDETSETRAGNARLARRIEAEQHYLGLPQSHVFRLAGIYGAGHSAIDDVRAGTARRIDKPGQVFSRIHVEDIAGALFASMQQPASGEIYNLCDDAPAPAHEVVAYACELLGHPVPPLLPWREAGLSAMGSEFYSASRRVSNRKLKEKLGYALQYPTYREGLQAIAKSLEPTSPTS